MMRKPVDFVKAKRETIHPAKEVLEYLYRVLLATPAIPLSDGTQASVERYIAPEINEEGQVRCGFDVRLANGSHLEFMIENTGWGKSFVDAVKPSSRRRSRER